MHSPLSLRSACAAVLALVLGGCATAPPRSPTPLAAAPGAISERTLKEITRTLASDEFEGREPGTPGEEKTVSYLARQFERVGLQPGNGSSWFQDVPLVDITAHNVRPLDIAGPGTALSFAYGSEWMGATYRERQRVELAGSEIVFVGFGIVAPERGWNDYAGIDMRGKTALILVNDPDYALEGLEGPFEGRAMTYYGRWTYKFEEAARQGAAAAIVVHDTFPAAYGWNVVESSFGGPQPHARRTDRGDDQPLVNGWVQKPVAERIVAAAGMDIAALSQAAAMPGFRPVPLGLTASTGFDNALHYYQSKNVIGILPGTARANEYFLYTAHWDHLGHCTPSEAGDDICNGAIDNGVGVAGLVALAEAHARAGPAERSLVFLSVTAEEAGLLGSAYYADHPIYPLSRTAGGLNMDGALMKGRARDVTVIGGGKSELDAILADALAASGRVATPDPAPEAGYYYRSDHFSLAKRGVPMFNLKSGQDLVAGGREAGSAAADHYRARLYHAADDEYDPAWDWSGLIDDLQLYYLLGRMLADGEDWPNWAEGDEFRDIRDADCAPAGGC